MKEVSVEVEKTIHKNSKQKHIYKSIALENDRKGGVGEKGHFLNPKCPQEAWTWTPKPKTALCSVASVVFQNKLTFLAMFITELWCEILKRK